MSASVALHVGRIMAVPAAIALLAAGATSATAAPAADTTTETITQPMTYSGIDEAQAAKVGNKVVTEGGFKILKDGKTGREITRVPLPGTITTFNTVYGDCGSSYVEINDAPGDRKVGFSTGFTVYKTAIDFDWHVSSEDSGGGYGGWSDYGPVRPTKTWTSGAKTIAIRAPGIVELQVFNSRAYMLDGGICTSGDPVDVEYAS